MIIRPGKAKSKKIKDRDREVNSSHTGTSLKSKCT